MDVWSLPTTSTKGGKSLGKQSLIGMQLLRESGERLFSIETKTPLDRFDILGFSLLYEMCYTNILSMLSLSGIPLLSSERGEDAPLICAGGPCVCNPEPIADIIDLFFFGDGVW